MAKKRSLEEAGIGNKGERAKSENLHKIRRQIDYYFGNFNLPKDRFMKRVIKHEGGGEWFPAEVLLKFKKIKALGATLDDIVDACDESEVVKMNMEQTHIKRIFALKGPKWVSARTIQAQGFPKEKMDINDLLEFWNKTCPGVKNVKFCGRGTGIISLSFEDKKLADEWAMNKHEVTFRGEKITLGRDLYKKPNPFRNAGNERGRDQGKGNSGGKGQGGDINGVSDSVGSGDKGGYHSTIGKRQKLSDDVAENDLIEKGMEANVQKPSEKDGEQRVEQEKSAEAEQGDEVKNEGMDVDIEKQIDKAVESRADHKKTVEAEKGDLEVKNEGMDVDVKKVTDTDEAGDKEDNQKEESAT